MWWKMDKAHATKSMEMGIWYVIHEDNYKGTDFEVWGEGR